MPGTAAKVEYLSALSLNGARPSLLSEFDAGARVGKQTGADGDGLVLEIALERKAGRVQFYRPGHVVGDVVDIDLARQSVDEVQLGQTDTGNALVCRLFNSIQSFNYSRHLCIVKKVFILVIII